MTSRKGQSIVEILVAAAVGVVLVTAGAALIAPSLKTNSQVTYTGSIASVGKALLDNVRAFSESDWADFSAVSTSSASVYYMSTSQSPYSLAPGIESTFVGSTTYYRYFYLDDVYRDASGTITTPGTGNYDPSTKLVSVAVLSPTSNPSVKFSSTSVWTNDTALPAITNNIQHFQDGWTSLIAANGYLYALGGAPNDTSATPTSNVYYSKVGPTGILATWNLTTSLPYPNTSAATQNDDRIVAVANNGYIYLIASGNGSNQTSTVFYAKSNSDGTLGSWLTTTPLPYPVDGATVVINSGHVYVISGGNNNNTLYSTINPDGTLGAWTIGVAAPNVGTGLLFATGASVGNRIYIPGGPVPLGLPAPTSTVYYTTVNADGSTSAWSQSTPLPTALQGTAIYYAGNLYVLGGDVGGGKSIYYAPVNPDFSLGAWVQGASFPKSNYSLFEFAVSGNYLIAIVPNDSKTQFVTVVVTGSPVIYQTYLTRNRSNVLSQSDWSGGAASSGPVTLISNQFTTSSNVSAGPAIGSITLLGTAGNTCGP